MEEQELGEELRLSGGVGQWTSWHQTLAHSSVRGAQCCGQEGSERQKGKAREERNGSQRCTLENERNVTTTFRS